MNSGFCISNWRITNLQFGRRDRRPHQTQNFSKEEIKDSSRNRDSQNASPDGFEPETPVQLSQQLQLSNHPQIFAIYPIPLLMYIVASPDPNPSGEGQLPNPNECNSTLTSARRREMLTPNPNEWN